MKKYDSTLFKIGEVIKITGVTRKTLLVYEDKFAPPSPSSPEKANTDKAT